MWPKLILLILIAASICAGMIAGYFSGVLEAKSGAYRNAAIEPFGFYLSSNIFMGLAFVLFTISAVLVIVR